VLTQIREEASRKKLEVIQGTHDFLLEIECPSQLRVDIIKWTRFHVEEATHIAQKKDLLSKMPADLQKGLLHHFFFEDVSRVPIFNRLANIVDNDDAIVRSFLNDIFLKFEYKMFSAGDVLIKFSDPADRLICLVKGLVDIEFEHPNIERDPVSLQRGDYIGDMALLGVRDWAESTRFFVPKPDPEPTDIQVTAGTSENVLVLELTTKDWDGVLRKSSVTQAHVAEFLEQWNGDRVAASTEIKQSKSEMRAVRSWEIIATKIQRRWRSVEKDKQHIMSLKFVQSYRAHKKQNDDLFMKCHTSESTEVTKVTVDKAHKLQVTVHMIDGFVDTAGFMDHTEPYVLLQLGTEKQKTSCKNNVRPSEKSRVCLERFAVAGS